MQEDFLVCRCSEALPQWSHECDAPAMDLYAGTDKMDPSPPEQEQNQVDQTHTIPVPSCRRESRVDSDNVQPPAAGDYVRLIKTLRTRYSRHFQNPSSELRSGLKLEGSGVGPRTPWFEARDEDAPHAFLQLMRKRRNSKIAYLPAASG